MQSYQSQWHLILERSWLDNRMGVYLKGPGYPGSTLTSLKSAGLCKEGGKPALVSDLDVAGRYKYLHGSRRQLLKLYVEGGT